MNEDLDDIDDLVEEELRNNNYSFSNSKEKQQSKIETMNKEKENHPIKDNASKRSGRSSKLSKDNRPGSPDDGLLNLSGNSNDDGLKAESG